MKKGLTLLLFLVTSIALFSVSAYGTAHLTDTVAEKADLTVEIVDSQEEVRVGGGFRIVTRIGNAGGNGTLNGTTADYSSFRVVLRLVDFEGYSSGFVLRDLHVIGLGGGQNLDWVLFWDSVPQIIPGRYKLEVVVDDDREIDETNETNNAHSVDLHVGQGATPRPETSCSSEGRFCLENNDCCLDLRCDVSATTCVVEQSDMSVQIRRSPGQIRIGDRHEIITTIINRDDNGVIPVDSPFKVALWLIDHENSRRKALLRELDVLKLGGGQQLDWRFFLENLPNNLGPGRYRFEAFVDSGLDVNESDEANNKATQRVTLLPTCSDVDDYCADSSDCCSGWDLECKSNTCQVICGLEGKSCCSIGKPCGGSLECVGSSGSKTCEVPCGSENEMCCSGSDKCDRDLECFGEGDTAICRQCGEEEDDPCCTAGSQCTGEGLVCDTDSSTCQPCGSGGEICCTERSCDEDGFMCEGSDPGLCRGTCGSGDQPCCIDNNGDENCGNGLVCANVQNERICKPCGENTQRCCGSGDKCGWNLGCFGRGSDAICQPCGRGGEQCCSSDKSYQCLSSFVCRSGTCTAEAEPSVELPPVVTQSSCADHPASGRVSILGVPQAGKTLTADTYTIQDAYNVGTLSYQWLRVVGNSESVIDDGPAYRLSSADVGNQIKVRVRFYDDLNCPEELESALTSVIVAEGTQIHCPNNAATGDITIEGVPQVGQSLEAVTSNIADSDGAANIMLTYKWYRFEDGNEITLPVTDPTYDPVSNDVGNSLQVEVAFTDNQGCHEELVSDLTDPVVAQANSGTTPGEKSDLIVEILDPPSEFTVPEGNSETSHDITIKVSNQGADTSDNMLGGASKFNFGLAFDRRSGSDFIDARLLEVFWINSLDRDESEERTSTFTLTSGASAGDYRFFAWVDKGGGGENNVSELDEDNNWVFVPFTVVSPFECGYSNAVCSDTQPCCSGYECSSNQCQRCYADEGTGCDLTGIGVSCCSDLKCVLGVGRNPDRNAECHTATGYHVCNRTPQVRDAIVSSLSARDCTVVTLTQLRSISALHLENKNIASLKEGDFEHLGNLEELHLEGNRLSSLDPEIFDDVFGLFDLSLADNNMDALPEGIFKNLRILDNIFLYGNDFNCIPQNAFGSRNPPSDLNVYFDAIGGSQSINDAFCEGTGGTGNLPDLSVSFSIAYHADGNQVDFLPTITATDVPTPYTSSYHYFTYNFSISDSNSQEIHRSRYSARVDDTNVVQLLTADGVGQYGVNNPIMIDTNNLFTPGEQYTFKVFVDSTHVIQESDEENNEDSIRLTFGTADTTDTTDLTVEIVPAPNFATIGELLYSGVDIKHGRSTFTEPINSVPYTLSLFKGNVLIDSRSGRHNIPAGVSGSGPGIRFTLPDDLTPGTYSLRATVNSGGAITETNYNNNDDSHTITLRCPNTGCPGAAVTDLTIRFFRVPASVDIGSENLSVWLEIADNSDEILNSVPYKVAFLNPDDVEIDSEEGTVDFYKNLGGISKYVEFDVGDDFDPGNYRVVATVNTHIRTITETNYDNNEHRYAVVFRCPNNQCPGDVVNFAATGYASITGTAQVGQTLTAGRGDIGDGNGVPSSSLFSYQWYRGSRAIFGATSVSYDVQQADLNYRLKVRVSFEDDAGYDESRDSRQTSTVTAAVVRNFAATGYASITGTAQVGQTLTAGRGDIGDGNGVPSSSLFSYQWYRGSRAIFGATSVSYDVQQADLNYRLKVRVSFEDDAGYDESRDSRQTSTVTAAVVQNYPAEGLPTISDTTPEVGQRLTADTSGIIDDDGLSRVSYDYQWYSDDRYGSNIISGATGRTYTVRSSDVGKRLRVGVDFSDDRGNREALVSSTTHPVARPCGGSGEVCCSGFTECDSGYQCINPETAISNTEVCVNCLPADNRCSSNSAACCQEKGAGKGLSCQDNGAFNACKPCARYGERYSAIKPCCPNQDLIAGGTGTCRAVSD